MYAYLAGPLTRIVYRRLSPENPPDTPDKSPKDPDWQQNDPDIREKVAQFSGDSVTYGRFRKLNVVRDQVLYRHPISIAVDEEGVVIPANKAEWLLQRFHDHEAANHPGWKETYRSINSRFFWSGMREAVRKYASSHSIKSLKIRCAPESHVNPERCWALIWWGRIRWCSGIIQRSWL